MTHRHRPITPSLPVMALAALLGTSVGCAACSNGCSDGAVAVVTHVEVEVERDRVASIETWEAAGLQDTISMGEAVRTGMAGRAVLELNAGGGLRLGADSLVRFGRRPDDDQPLTLEWGRGEIDVETTDALIITTEFGPIRVQRGSHIVAVYGEDGLRVEVIFGLAQLGDGTRLTAGAVSDRRSRRSGPAPAPTPPEPAPEVAEAAGSSDAGVPGSIDLDGGVDGGVLLESGPRVPGIAGYEFSVAGGAGGVIHHPSPPAIVGINTGCADGEVRVESSGVPTTYTGGGTVGVRMSRGATRYEVRCGGQTAASGRFTVTGDSGRRRLNNRSQRHTVAADGRRYTFLYEGAMPTLLLRWNGAPPAPEYTVSFTGTRRVARLTSATPTASLPRSALRDGEMTFQFSGGGRQSPRTTVTLRYDTATPTAMVDSPPDRGFAGGAGVTVSGTAQVGSQVAVGGQQLAVDPRGAFSGTASAEGGGLAVRITTPNQGTHYFVRRSAGQ